MVGPYRTGPRHSLAEVRIHGRGPHVHQTTKLVWGHHVKPLQGFAEDEIVEKDTVLVNNEPKIIWDKKLRLRSDEYCLNKSIEHLTFSASLRSIQAKKDLRSFTMKISTQIFKHETLTHLQEVVCNGEWYDDGQEDRGGVGDGDDGSHETGDPSEESDHSHTYCWVRHVHILAEAIQDATDGCRVEEWHRGTHDA